MVLPSFFRLSCTSAASSSSRFSPSDLHGVEGHVLPHRHEHTPVEVQQELPVQQPAQLLLQAHRHAGSHEVGPVSPCPQQVALPL